MMTSTCFGNMRIVLLLYTIQVCITYIHAGHYAAAFNTKGNASTLIASGDKVKILPSCAKLCERHHCLSFAYNQEQNKCRIYSGMLLTAKKKQRANGFRFFMKRTNLQEKEIELHNLSTGFRLSINNDQIFEVTKKNSQNYVHIRFGYASLNVLYLNRNAIGCFTQRQRYTDQQWSMTENIDGTVTFQNAYNLQCLCMDGTRVTARKCSPYDPRNSWKIIVM